MLRELLNLQALTVALTIPAHQQTTKYADSATLPNQPTPMPTTFPFTGTAQSIPDLNDLNDNYTIGILFEPISRQVNEPAMARATNPDQNTGLNNQTEALKTRHNITAKKTAKNSFPFYAYILFALVPVFTLFILLR